MKYLHLAGAELYQSAADGFAGDGIYHGAAKGVCGLGRGSIRRQLAHTDLGACSTHQDKRTSKSEKECRTKMKTARNSVHIDEAANYITPIVRGTTVYLEKFQLHFSRRCEDWNIVP